MPDGSDSLCLKDTSGGREELLPDRFVVKKIHTYLYGRKFTIIFRSPAAQACLRDSILGCLPDSAVGIDLECMRIVLHGLPARQ